MDDLTPSGISLVEALQEVVDKRDKERREDSNSEIKLVRKLIQWKDLGLALLFFGTLIGGAIVTFDELASKPTIEQMQEAVEERVQPIEIKQVDLDDRSKKIKTNVDNVKTKVDRIEDVQSYQLEQQAWEGKVLEHLGAKKSGKAPERPEALEARERELLQK